MFRILSEQPAADVIELFCSLRVEFIPLSTMECSACAHPTIAFRTPEAVRDHAPGETVSICTRCLAIESTSETPENPEFSAIIDAFPDGKAGAAMALGVGLLVDSLVLNRAAIADCLAHVNDTGADPWLVMERLAASGAVQPDADMERARRQLAQLVD